VRGEDEARLLAHVCGKSIARLQDVLRIRANEQRMIEPAPDIGHVDVDAVAPHLRACVRNVLTILLTARVAVMRRGDESDRATGTVGVHLPQRVGKERMPVAHPDVDRQRLAGCSKTRAQPVRLSHCDRGQRRHTVEQFVMVRDLLDALGRHPAAAQHVREKRTNVIAPLRATKRNDQNRIEHGSVFVSSSTLNLAAASRQGRGLV
jgi:hypothetical protein